MERKKGSLMKKLLATAGLFLLLQTAAVAAPLKIGIIGDQTGAPQLDDLSGPYAELTKGVAVLKGQGVSAALHVGDLVESTLAEDRIRTDFNAATTILNGLGVPWYLTAGDHDVNPPVFVQDSQDRSRETLFKSLYSALNPKVADHLYYSFDLEADRGGHRKGGRHAEGGHDEGGEYHFIALYAEEHLHTDPRWGTVFFAGISDAQFAWLAQDLQANADKTGIVVVVHQPLWYNWSTWARVHELLRQYPVVAVIAGHFHYNQDEGLLDGIRYLVVGATGAKTKTGTENAGDLQHVTVMTLDGKNVSFNAIDIDDSSPVAFTSRFHMDRLQAIDQTLGNMYDFAQKNPVFLKGNKLVGDCATETPAQLQVYSIGNPTEMQVNLSLKLFSDTPSIQITSAQFTPGLCLADLGPYDCQLPPSQWIAVSNTSMTQLAYGKEGQALWTGVLGLTGSPPVTPQQLKLRVGLSFTAPDGENFLIYMDEATTLTSCSE